MLLFDMLSWWYTAGWWLRFSSTASQLKHWSDFFDFKTLLTTMLAPWRQIAASGSSSGRFMAKLIDKTVSRLVGFSVRLMVLIAGIVVIAGILILNVLYILLWPLLPMSPLFLIGIGAT